MTKFCITEEISDDYTEHVPLVLAHWERSFQRVYRMLSQEMRSLPPKRAPWSVFSWDTGLYMFERYNIVLELAGDTGTALRMYFPDEATELMMLLRA